MREEPKHQRRVTLAAIMLDQRREAKGVSFSVGGAAEGSSGVRRTFREGRSTLVSYSSKHRSSHDKQQK